MCQVMGHNLAVATTFPGLPAKSNEASTAEAHLYSFLPPGYVTSFPQ